MSERGDVQALLREGVAEARLGNRDAARVLLEKVVALDPENEKGWLWLASVAATDQDQLTYLRRVLALNPGNESAQRALERLQTRVQAFETPDEVIPGVSRRQMRVVLVVGAVVIVLVVLALVVTLVNNNRTATANVPQTELAILNANATATAAAQIALAATETQIALLPTITPTATEIVRTAVPTWTPTATSTPLQAVAAALPTPEGLAGTLVGWSGRDILSNDFLPVGTFNVADGRFTPVGTVNGRDVRLHPNGQRLIYTRYEQSMASNMLETISLSGTQAESINARWEGSTFVLNAQMPDYSPDGSLVTFIAQPQDSSVPQLYMVSLGELPAGVDPLRRLTNDGATYSDPAISPDGNRIAVVKDDRNGPAPGADIVIIDIQTLAQTSLTTDLGTFVESAPRWSPDGQQIAYAAAAANDAGNNDIAIRASAGFGLPTLPVRDPGNDIKPVFSPDGRKLAFASNRGGQYDIYIYDLETQALSQLTNTPEEDYPGGWR